MELLHSKKDHNKVSHAFVAQVNPPTSVFRGQVSTTQKGLMADDGQGGVTVCFCVKLLSILLLEAVTSVLSLELLPENDATFFFSEFGGC